MSQRRALVFQHMDDDHLGRFGEFLAADGVRPETVMLHRGATIPELAPYELMIVLGGPQQVWEEDKHPWLIAEKAAIRQWVGEMKRPYLGFCFGHQLLADAMGGKVGRAREQEIGVYEVARTAPHAVFEGLPARFAVTQWHAAEVQELPPGATALAASPVTAIQAMSVNGCALGLQFHLEWNQASVDGWERLPNYMDAMERALGPGAYEAFRAKVRPMMDDYHRIAETVYANWKAAVVGRAGAPA